MGLDSWISAEKGAFESAEVFVKPPFRSRQFLATTFLVALFGLLDIGVLIKLGGRLTVNGDVCVLFMFVTVLGSFLRALVVHKKLYELLASGTLKGASGETSTNTALRAASSLSYWGPASAVAVGFFGLGTLIIVFLSLLGR